MEMKTFYIDHNILVNEDNWPKLAKLVTAGYCPALSDWNLVEIASGADKKQALQRMEFIETLNPTWFIPIEIIQKCEVKNFLLKNFYNTEYKACSPLVDCYSKVLAYDIGKAAPPDFKAINLVKSWQSSPEIFAPIALAKKSIPESLKIIQGIDKKTQKLKEEEIFRSWIGTKLPQRDLNGKELSPDEKKNLLDFLYKNKDLLLKESPSIAIEDVLYDIRNKDAARPPQTQDAADMQHSILALSYCDYFVTRDGFVRHCAEFASRTYKTAKVLDALDGIQ